MDNWQNRSKGMRCGTCIVFAEKIPAPFFLSKQVPKEIEEKIAETVELGEFEPVRAVKAKRLGRCRRHAPTLGGWPAVWSDDWCGDHKLDENKVDAESES